MQNRNGSGANQMGFLGWLLLLFIGLKLADVLAWSWLWVLAPLWVPVALVVALTAVRTARKRRAGAQGIALDEAAANILRGGGK